MKYTLKSKNFFSKNTQNILIATPSHATFSRESVSQLKAFTFLIRTTFPFIPDSRVCGKFLGSILGKTRLKTSGKYPQENLPWRFSQAELQILF